MSKEEQAALTGIKWRDEDLKNIEKVESSTNVIIIGDIMPPLSEEEIEVIALDPKFCVETNVTVEEIKVSLSEAKVKRIWSELSKPVIEEGEEPPSEEEIMKDQEQEDEMRRLFNYDNCEFDYACLRVTDSKFNRRTFLPKQKIPHVEMLETIKTNKIIDEAKDWISNHCDDKGNQLRSNITPAQRKGMIRLKGRIERGEVIVVPTDKSGKMAVMSLTTYAAMGDVHIAKDRVIDEIEAAKIQKELNDHAEMLIKIFSVGEAHGDRNIQRIKSAFTTNAVNVAVLWLMPKDHKTVKEGVPMPSRPVVSITSSMLARASKLVTNVVKSIADN